MLRKHMKENIKDEERLNAYILHWVGLFVLLLFSVLRFGSAFLYFYGPYLILGNMYVYSPNPPAPK